IGPSLVLASRVERATVASRPSSTSAAAATNATAKNTPTAVVRYVPATINTPASQRSLDQLNAAGTNTAAATATEVIAPNTTNTHSDASANTTRRLFRAKPHPRTTLPTGRS